MIEDMLNFSDDPGDLLKSLGLEEGTIIPDVPEVDDTVGDNNTPESSEKVDDNDSAEDYAEGAEVKDKDVDTPPKVDTKDNNTSSILSSIAQSLLEEGYFTLKDDEKLEIKSTEDFAEVLEKIRETALETEQEDWTDTQKEYFEALRGGVPHEQIAQHQQTQQAYSNITDEVLEDESDQAAELRKNILVAGFKARGFNETKAINWAKKSIDSGSDIDDAKEFRDELKVLDKERFKASQELTKQQQAEAEKKAQEDSKELRTYVNTVKEIIPGKEITPKLRKEILDGVTKAVYTDEKTGQQYNALGDFIRRNGQKGVAKLVYMLKTTNEFENTDGLSTSKARKSVVDKLNKTLSNSSSNTAFAKSDGEDFKYDDYSKIVDMALNF